MITADEFICNCFKKGMSPKLLGKVTAMQFDKRILFPLQGSALDGISVVDVKTMEGPLRELVREFKDGVLTPLQLYNGMQKYDEWLEGALTSGCQNKRQAKAFLMGESVKIIDVWSWVRRLWRKSASSNDPCIRDLKSMMVKRSAAKKVPNLALKGALRRINTKQASQASDDVEELLTELDDIQMLISEDESDGATELFHDPEFNVAGSSGASASVDDGRCPSEGEPSSLWLKRNSLP